MKTIKINLPLMALLLGVCLIFTQSAFKGKRDTILYGRVVIEDEVTWQDLTTATIDSSLPYAHNSYRCTPATGICTAEFDDTNPPIDNSSTPTGSETTGKFIYTP